MKRRFRWAGSRRGKLLAINLNDFLYTNDQTPKIKDSEMQRLRRGNHLAANR